jgi:hypothetical protein
MVALTNFFDYGLSSKIFALKPIFNAPSISLAGWKQKKHLFSASLPLSS